MNTSRLPSMCALSVLLVLAIPAVCSGQQSVAGTYKLTAFTIEIDDQPPREVFGKAATGYAIITPTRFMAILTAEGRKPGPSAAEKAGLWDSLIAVSGPYRLEGDKLIIAVDISWNETWNGTNQSRRWQLEDGRHARGMGKNRVAATARNRDAAAVRPEGWGPVLAPGC